MKKHEHRIPSPQNDKRACLCPDGTYSRKCCDGSFQAQGMGNITKTHSVLLTELREDLEQEDSSKILL